MASVSTLEDLVAPYCKGAPVLLIQKALMEAAREFMRFTRWHRESLAFDVTEADRSYALAPTDNTLEVFAVTAAQFDGEPLEAQIPANVRSGTEGFYFFTPPGTLKLTWDPAADVSDGLAVEMCLVVKSGETAIPDAVLRRWGNELAYGALANLLDMEKTAWYSPGMARKNMALWAKGNEDAHYEANNQAKAYSLSNMQNKVG